MNNGEINKHFKNKTVFVTGATGSYGHSFVYQLLKVDVEKVYCLVHGPNAETRLKFNDPRVITVVGDISEKNLGISNPEEFVDHIDMFVHAAANTGFTMSMNTAFNDNVRGT
jgi:thioester reductase-like protein